MNLLTTNEAAVQLGLDPSLIRRYCREGRIEAQQVGRDWVIEQEALDTFAEIPRKVGKPPATQPSEPEPATD